MTKVKSTTGQVHIMDPYRVSHTNGKPLTLCMATITEKWTTGDGDNVTCPHCKRLHRAN